MITTPRRTNSSAHYCAYRTNTASSYSAFNRASHNLSTGVSICICFRHRVVADVGILIERVAHTLPFMYAALFPSRGTIPLQPRERFCALLMTGPCAFTPRAENPAADIESNVCATRQKIIEQGWSLLRPTPTPDKTDPGSLGCLRKRH